MRKLATVVSVLTATLTVWGWMAPQPQALRAFALIGYVGMGFLCVVSLIFLALNEEGKL